MRAIGQGLPLLAVALLLVLGACDGDDGLSANGPDGSAPLATAPPLRGGSDENYVREFCALETVFERDLSAAAQTLLDRGIGGIGGIGDPGVLSETVVPPLQRYIDDLRKLDPPADVRPYHNDLVQAVEAQVQLILTGGFDAEALGEHPFVELVEPPSTVQARLAAVAATAPGCEGVDFFDQ